SSARSSLLSQRLCTTPLTMFSANTPPIGGSGTNITRPSVFASVSASEPSTNDADLLPLALGDDGGESETSDALIDGISFSRTLSMLPNADGAAEPAVIVVAR